MKKWSVKKIVIVSIVSIIGLAVVGVGTFMLVNILSRPTKTYENIDEDSEVIRQRNTYETYLTTSIDDYASFSTLQKIDISLYKLRVIDNYYASTSGKVTIPNVPFLGTLTQDVASMVIKEGDRYFLEDISSSPVVKASNRYYQEGAKITYYNGTYKDMTGGTYSESNKTDFSLKDFYENWGRTLDNPTLYVINENSISNEVANISEGDYHISLEMDTTISVSNYVKWMKKTGGLGDYPVFKQVKLDFVIDSSLNLKSLKIDEVYDSYRGFAVSDLHGEMTVTFTNEHKSIPSLDEKAF